MLTNSDKDKRSRDLEKSSIAAFYAGRSIFITGGTGFMGKVLIEKLLRSCPDVREIFMLMRPKNGLSIDERLKKMLQSPLYEKLRKEKPSSFEKLIPVLGDTSQEGLGLPEIERRVIIDRVSIIFHVAANVRFNENLKKDVISNTRSTRDVCILAGSMKNLVALVHVSSAFAHSDKPVVDEIVYPPIINWRDTIKMVETLDEETLRIFSRKYLGSMPNTYTFSKRLAEQVINDYSKDLPCVIFRPSIVVSTVEDPISGWLDNFNGPVGMLIGGGKGVLRVICVDPKTSSDYLPVDVAIKAMLTSTWKRGLQTITKDPSVHVYNCASCHVHRIIIQELVSVGMKTNKKVPLNGIIWYPRTMLTSNRFIHYVMTFLLHFLPALVIDGALKLAGHKPILFNIQKKVYSAAVQLDHFVHNEWTFHNSKMLDILTKEVPPAEREIFGYDLNNFNMEQTFENFLIGAKRYLLHEDLNKIDEAKRHYNRMMWIDRIFNATLVILITWFVFKIGLFSYLVESVSRFVDGSFLAE